MMELLQSIFSKFTTRGYILGALDVLIVAYLIYRVLLMIRGTRAAQMIAGLVLIGVAYLAVPRLELGTLGWLLDKFLPFFIILVIVVFQDDIRRGLMRMGRRMFLARRQREETYLVEEVVRAVERMARLRTGALIVFERVAALDEFIQPGTPVDSRVSRELLWSIFRVDAENPVHDGAVIIRMLRIHQAGALLPLSHETELERSLGTRHRAALGITEETDAVAVVVSEERGSIAICHLGQIVQNVDVEALRAALLDIFRKPRRGTMRDVVRNKFGSEEKPPRSPSSGDVVASAPAKAGGEQ